MPKPSIHFLKVSTSSEKLSAIVSTIHSTLMGHKKMLIVMPNHQAAEFLDKHLWQANDESFIPHCISNIATNERIVITIVHENVNGASVLLNLNTFISPISHSFETIYDLDDHTSPEKAQLSKERQLQYKALKL